MSDPEGKLRGNPEKPSELTRLKALWRKKFTEEQKEMILGWHDDPNTTNAAARQGLQKLFGVKLSRDGQLSEFWGWVSQQEDLESTNELLENFEEFTRKRNKDWSPEKVRATAIEFFLAHTTRKRDASKFATILQLDQNERFAATKAKFEERKVQVSERRMTLLEKKAKQADEARAVSASELTPEQKNARMKQIFGMA